MSIRDEFVKNIVDLMGKEGNFDFDERINALTNILLTYKDELPGDEYEQVLSDRKSSIDRKRDLEDLLERQTERKTDRSVSGNIRSVLER